MEEEEAEEEAEEREGERGVERRRIISKCVFMVSYIILPLGIFYH